MQFSVIIPVWNGLSVLSECLDALYARSDTDVMDVICVDNASQDESADLITSRYPQVHLVRQPVNLGFAGGVNAGIEAARGEVLFLLNQDCLVQPGWLAALSQALESHPEFGIAGCTLLNRDGSVNHAGASIRRPGAYGQHLTDIGNSEPRPIEAVTGAAMAIRRHAWDVVGPLDEGFYPAYYEDVDYCFRARHRGLAVGYVPQARIVHLLSSHEWQADPLKHTANQHQARYRFVSKHWDGPTIAAFFEAESAAIDAEGSYDQAVGRAVAARDTLRCLPDILQRRLYDLDDALPAPERRQLQVGFTQVLRQSIVVASRLAQRDMVRPEVEQWEATNRRQQEALEQARVAQPLLSTPSQDWEAINQELQAIQQREHALLAQIHFRSPTADEPETRLHRLFRLLLLRPLSLLIGREHVLLAELNAVHVARMDLLARRMDLLARRMGHQAELMSAQLVHANSRIDQVHQLYHERHEQMRLIVEYQQEQLERRLELLQALIDYDYR